MKARLLKKLLNNTGYIVADHGEYIGVGSPLCHNLFSVNKETLKVKYALSRSDVPQREDLCGKGEPLLFIWDKLNELVETEQIHEIINGNDTIENPLPVFAVVDGILIETFTDEYGWPNVTTEGLVMGDGIWFSTKTAAIERGIESCKSSIRWATEHADQLLLDLQKVNDRIDKLNENERNLKAILV